MERYLLIVQCCYVVHVVFERFGKDNLFWSISWFDYRWLRVTIVPFHGQLNPIRLFTTLVSEVCSYIILRSIRVFLVSRVLKPYIKSRMWTKVWHSGRSALYRANVHCATMPPFKGQTRETCDFSFSSWSLAQYQHKSWLWEFFIVPTSTVPETYV